MLYGDIRHNCLYTVKTILYPFTQNVLHLKVFKTTFPKKRKKEKKGICKMFSLRGPQNVPKRTRNLDLFGDILSPICRAGVSNNAPGGTLSCRDLKTVFTIN